MSKDPLQIIELVKRDISDLRKDLGKLEDSLTEFKKQYTKEVTSNLNTWNATSDNLNRVVWIVVGSVIVGVLTLLGLQ